MNTLNNSNTIHFCKDCEDKSNISLSACKYGHGINILPCYILRKLAKKCTSIYNKCYKNEDNLINDYYDHIRNWCGYDFGIKYLNSLSMKKELIMLAMSFVVNSHTNEDLDFINEFSADLELDVSDRNKVIRLYTEIFRMQIKINDEWFAIPENKEFYINTMKAN